ncbi:DUF3560 domain-containing protein [Cerasicoccus frondis]|uniref:DUF3560 domain-containing protein n=1 Tax=Cerasicoccus frondis TaxID=490090 RepID=UPI002852C113|nr:DUF3560 domain-containing protein [Cerasicoccus frondis]
MKLDQSEIQTGEATYCPEDNKLRLYVGRVPREEYIALKDEGWTSTPKQESDFVATWSTRREDTALAYGEGVIGDEDQEPAERAADRAERFGGYCDKRLAEAHNHAGAYAGQPLAHGFQNEAKAQRAARRHDRLADHAVNAWDKAEYWQHRTAGVIRHALYISSPGVRMGRIKRLESELRDVERTIIECRQRWQAWAKVGDDMQAALKASSIGNGLARYLHPRPEEVTNSYIRENGSNLYSLLTMDKDGYGKPITPAEAVAIYQARHHNPDADEWHDTRTARRHRHLQNRIAYENQMLKAQGGRLEQSDIEPGGKLGGKLILRVNRSNATKRVTSVAVIGPKVEGYTYKARNIKGTEWAEYQIDTQRLDPAAYKAPTDESKAELAKVKKAIKAAKAKGPKALQLINPTDADAERLQAVWNTDPFYKRDKPAEVHRMTQAEYSAQSKGTYAACESVCIEEGGQKDTGRALRPSPYRNLCKVRCHHRHVIILTDKPQKPLPPEVFTNPKAEARAWCKENLELCHLAVIAKRNESELTDETLNAWNQLNRAKWAESRMWRHAEISDELDMLFREAGTYQKATA